MPLRAASRWIGRRFGHISFIALFAVSALAPAGIPRAHAEAVASHHDRDHQRPASFDEQIRANAREMIDEGRRTFRFDTFGDEAFWGDTLHLHEAIEGAQMGGVGGGLSPAAALSLGLKVDVDALSPSTIQALQQHRVDLTDPAVTLQLLRSKAVVGVIGFFSGDRLDRVGITCALCHSTVDDSLAFGIGHRLDGWANRDLDVGTIISLAPDLSVVTNLLGVDSATLTTVLKSWGPGKFDAEVFLDGKAFNPQQMTDGVVTGTQVPGATLLPNAFGLAGFNQHTWTGSWGSVPYWNALVATLEMHGKGRFFDPRLNDGTKFPLAAANGLADLAHISPDEDRVTAKLPALQFYQLALPAPTPRPGRDFDPAAAKRGDELFSGKARCNDCHVEPLWTEPGWNLHKPEDIGIDSFEADRAPDGQYKTMNLAGLFVRENGIHMQPANKGRYYHDGRFKTLADVVKHYDTFFHLGLSGQEQHDLVEYLKSLPQR